MEVIIMKNNYAEVLESYMIPAEEAEKSWDEMSTKSKIASALMMTAITALGIGAIVSDAKDSKKRREYEANQRRENEAKAKRDKEEYEKWKQSPEYAQMVKYVSNKYKIDYPNIADKEALIDKLEYSILADLKKIANGINRNRKLCTELANKYLEHARRQDPDYFEKHRKSYEDEANEIKAGPAMAEVFETGEFTICEIDQIPRTWVCCEYLFDAFCKTINEKYYREIKLGLMSKMRDLGDGDEGLIGCSF